MFLFIKKYIFQRSEDIVVIYKYCYKTYINLKSTGNSLIMPQKYRKI